MASVALAFGCAAAAAATPDNAPPTQLLHQIYQNGIARMASGDARRAIPVFRLVREVAPEVPEANYQLALAITVGDFKHRDKALPEIDRAMAEEPNHPLFAIVRILADPAQSQLRSDGALYFTARSTESLRDAVARLPTAMDGYNAHYLVPILSRLEPTADPNYPFRLAGFARMIGEGGAISLPELGAQPQPLGRLFAVSVEGARLSPYEGRLIARLNGGLGGLVAEGPSDRDAARR
jgi:hypothetical protein